MSLIAPYVDGKLQTSTTSSESLKNSSNKSTVDSDTFLTLLVAEMQNQDPLEPTSNTEWVSQYATFTQVEQMTEMGESMDMLRANSMIGKEVVMKVTSESTGETSYKRGVVDYVTVEEGKAFLVIDEEKYSMSDLDSVASEEYFDAYDKYTEFTGMLDALPSLNLLDKSYENTVGKVYDLYNSLTEYQKDYVDKYASGYVESYKAYLKKMEQLGVTYGETTEAEEEITTLDDVLEAFNKKMDALMTQITTLSNNIQSNASGNQSSGVTEVNNAVDHTQSGSETGSSDVTDSTQSGSETGSSDVTDSTQSGNETGSSDVTDSTQSGNETGSSDVTDSTQAGSETGSSSVIQAAEETGSVQTSAGDESATDDVLDQLTKDTENV